MESAPNDEIDVLELLAKAVLTIKRNLLSFIIAFIVGTGIGLCYYQFVPKVYGSKMIVLSDILTDGFCKPLSETLDNLIKERNTKVLSEKLGLTIEEASQIEKIIFESLKDKDKDKKDIKESSTFLITVSVGNNSVLPKLQEGILSYLRNNEFVKIKTRQNHTLYQTMIDKIGIEIRSLDSLKRKLFLGQPVYSKSSEMLLVEPSSIYSKIIDLSREQLTLKNQLELVNSIQLVEGFTAFDNPASPKLSLSLAAGSSMGIFFVIMIIVFKGLRGMIRLSEEKLGTV